MNARRAFPRAALAAALAAAIAAALVYRDRLDVEAVEAWLAGFGLLAPPVYLVLYTMGTVAFLPGALFALAGGALPAAFPAWRQSALGRIADMLEQRLILDLIGPPDGETILDVGCGDGVLGGANVVGVDLSERIVAAARKRAKERGADVRFDIARAVNSGIRGHYTWNSGTPYYSRLNPQDAPCRRTPAHRHHRRTPSVLPSRASSRNPALTRANSLGGTKP